MVDTNPAGFLWVKLCKKYFNFENDMFICFRYIPPKDSVYFKNVDTNLFDILEIDIRHYADFGKVAVIGDLNARTGLSSDQFENCENLDRYIPCLHGADLNTANKPLNA